MAKRKNEPSEIRNVLKDFIQSNKLEDGLNKVSVNELWHQVMGPGVSGYTRNVKLEGSTLFIALDSSVLREELSYGKEKIIKLMNDALQQELIKKLILR